MSLSKEEREVLIEALYVHMSFLKEMGDPNSPRAPAHARSQMRFKKIEDGQLDIIESISHKLGLGLNFER